MVDVGFPFVAFVLVITPAKTMYHSVRLCSTIRFAVCMHCASLSYRFTALWMKRSCSLYIVSCVYDMKVICTVPVFLASPFKQWVTPFVRSHHTSVKITYWPSVVGRESVENMIKSTYDLLWKIYSNYLSLICRWYLNCGTLISLTGRYILKLIIFSHGSDKC